MKTKGLLQRGIKCFLFLIISGLLAMYLMESASESFQNDSEGLAVSPIVAEVLNLKIDKEGVGLGHLFSVNSPKDTVYRIMGDAPHKLADGYKYSAYKSQIGLQGMAYSVAAKILPKLSLYRYLRYACCFFLVVVVLLILLELYKKYGILLSLIFGLVTLASPWVIDFSRNLYWVEFTWFLPILLGLWCLNYKEKRKFIYPLFFIAIFIKCLCGYEYISTIMISSVLFLVVEWICKKEERKSLGKSIVISGVASVLGFFAAFFTHAFVYGRGSFAKGLDLMYVNLIQRRTFGNAADFKLVYADSLKASVFDVLEKYFWSAGKFYNGKIMLAILLMTIVAIVYQRFVLKKNNLFEISVFVVSLLATLSWLVLGKSHSYIHTHINFVLFYMGWFQVSVYIICKVIMEKYGLELKFGKGMARSE